MCLTLSKTVMKINTLCKMIMFMHNGGAQKG